MGLLTEFRKWLDADEEESKAIASDSDIKPRNKAEEFLVGVARAVEKTMIAEMFTPPGGPTYIPKEYVVYLSTADDDEWRGEKRRGLEQGLYHVLSERASAIASEQQIQASSFAVDLKVDGTLPPGQFRVQAVWDTETAKTMVKARKPATSGSLPGGDTDATRVRPRSAPTDEEATLVQSRKPLFSIAVKKSGSEIERRDFSQRTVTIGREAKSAKVDLALAGDMEISRRQAVIKFEDGRFTITCEGKNSIFVGGAELIQGKSVEVENGKQILIGDFSLEIVPAVSKSGELAPR